MDKKIILAVLVCFSLLFPLASGFSTGKNSIDHSSIATSLTIESATQASQKVLIGFNGPPRPSLVRNHGGTITHQYTIINGIAANLPTQAIQPLQKNPNVAYIEKDQKVHLLSDTLPLGVDRIDAEVVWGGSDGSKDIVTDGNAGSGVQVAVVDTGIDYTHPDLDDNYLDGYDFVNGDDDPKDDNGHGTHVSGTIAAEDNEEGVLGVAPKTGIYALKALDKRGSGYISDILAGIEWAVEGPNEVQGDSDDAEVVSMSLGGSGSTSLKNAVDSALNKGTLPVAAAGNDGTSSVSYPAAYSSVVAVSATDSSDNLASFSNYGDEIELAAPGVNILSTMPTYHVYLNGRYHMSQDYDTMDGTSMACPHVAGTAALVFAAGETNANNVRSILQDSAEDLGTSGWDNYYGYGLVDAEAAVDSTSVGEPPTVSWVNPADGETVTGMVDIQIDASDTEDAAGSLTVEWQVDGGSWQTASYDSGTGYYEATWDSTGVSDKDHTLNAEATDSDGNTATNSITVTTENTNNAPTVSWVNPADGETVTGMVDIQLDASDDRDSGSNLAVEWQINDSTWQTAKYNPTSGYYEGTWNSSTVSDGDYNLTARATDSNDKTSENRITVSVNNEAGGMYVSDISFREVGPHLEATITIRVDSDGDGVAESSDDPVNDATVAITITYEDGTTKSYTVTTDSSGEASVKWKQAPSGTYTVEVTELTHDMYTWNSDLDADNPDTYTL